MLDGDSCMSYLITPSMMMMEMMEMYDMTWYAAVDDDVWYAVVPS